MELNIYKILNKTKAEGPGERFCIWVQGCSRKCKGCFAPQTWAKEQGIRISVDEIFNKIKETKGIEGVTFLGGEPFEQAEALSLLAEMVKKINLSVVTFTGFEYKEIKNINDNSMNRLLKYTDILIDGAYKEELFDITKPWIGSENQRYIFLSERYSPDEISNYNNKIEVHIDKKGLIFINGMGDFKNLKENIVCTK